MISNLEHKKVLLTELVFDDFNARRHGAKNKQVIKKSLESFGQVEPLVVQKTTMKVLGGNARLEVMQSLGWTTCDVVLVDLDEDRQKALAVMLNRAGETAEWDKDTLKNTLQDLDLSGWDLDAIGFDELDLKLLDDTETFTKNDDLTGSKEFSEDEFKNFDHQCPRCGFEFDGKE
jgi:ParB-like chromosome segregation protein Spo0J